MMCRYDAHGYRPCADGPRSKQAAAKTHRVHFLVFSPVNQEAWLEIHTDNIISPNGMYDGDQNATTVDVDPALDPPGKTWRDRPAVQRAEGVYLAGDMVAAPGCLSEIAWASAIDASCLAVSSAGAGARRAVAG